MANCIDTNWQNPAGQAGWAVAAFRKPRSRTIAGIAAGLVETLQMWHSRISERRQLLGLDDRMLKDIGVSRADAEAEASKPFYI